MTVQRYLRDAGYKTAILGQVPELLVTCQGPPYFDRWALVRPDSYLNADFNIDGTVGPVSGYRTDDRIPHRQAATGVRPPGRQALVPLRCACRPAPARHPGAPIRGRSGHAVRAEPGGAGVRPLGQASVDSSQSVPLATMQTERDKMLRTLMSADDMVGKVFHELRALDERQDTLAIFLSDNGYAWGEHGIRGKWRPYTESIRVPLAMRWPKHFEPGSIDTGIATNVDLAPTIMAAAGLSPTASRWTASHCCRERGSAFRGALGKHREGEARLGSDTEPPRRLHRVLPGRRALEPDLPRVLPNRPRRLAAPQPPPRRRLGEQPGPAGHWKDLIRLYATCAGSTCPGSS